MTSPLRTIPPMARVAIIGAGLAGLACAHALRARGVEWTILEASDGVGGRVRTDIVDGFRLDRGFQVYLTAYRAAGELLEYAPLSFRRFRAGAEVFDGRGFTSVSNPLRHPVAAIAGLAGNPSMAIDLARMAPVALEAVRRPVTEPAAPAGSTEAMLRRLDLGSRTVDGFFRSFFGGVFLDRSLSTDESQFRFVFSSFARGETVVPALGMGEIPKQLAASLPQDRIRLRCPVASIARRGAGHEVRLASGAIEAFDAVVIATDMTAARALDPRIPARPWCATATFHWACALSRLPAPLRRPTLFLDGTGEGPVNHLACLSSVAPEYAPPGQALVALNMVDVDWSATGMSAITARTVTQMERWFGAGAMRGWHLLRTDRVVRALPRQHTQDLHSRPSTEIDDGLFVAGDHVTDGSIDGAVRSGMLAAEAAARAVAGGAARGGGRRGRGGRRSRCGLRVRRCLRRRSFVDAQHRGRHLRLDAVADDLDPGGAGVLRVDEHRGRAGDGLRPERPPHPAEPRHRLRRALAERGDVPRVGELPGRHAPAVLAEPGGVARRHARHLRQVGLQHRLGLRGAAGEGERERGDGCREARHLSDTR